MRQWNLHWSIGVSGNLPRRTMAPPPDTARRRDLPKFLGILIAVIVVLGVIFYIGNDWYGGSRRTDDRAAPSTAGVPGSPATMPPGSQPQGANQQQQGTTQQ